MREFFFKNCCLILLLLIYTGCIYNYPYTIKEHEGALHLDLYSNVHVLVFTEHAPIAVKPLQKAVITQLNNYYYNPPFLYQFAKPADCILNVLVSDISVSLLENDKKEEENRKLDEEYERTAYDAMAEGKKVPEMPTYYNYYKEATVNVTYTLMLTFEDTSGGILKKELHDTYRTTFEFNSQESNSSDIVSDILGNMTNSATTAKYYNRQKANVFDAEFYTYLGTQIAAMIKPELPLFHSTKLSLLSVNPAVDRYIAANILHKTPAALSKKLLGMIKNLSKKEKARLYLNIATLYHYAGYREESHSYYYAYLDAADGASCTGDAQYLIRDLGM